MRGVTRFVLSAWFLVGCGSDVETTPPGMVTPKLATFPGESGSCQVQHPPTQQTTTYTWNRDARRLESELYQGAQQLNQSYWLFDELGRVVEQGFANQPSRRMSYDEHGTLTEVVQLDSPANSFDQANSYDSEGRLLSSVMSYRAADLRDTRTYVYTGDMLERIDRVQEFAGGGPLESSERYVRVRGRVTSAIRENASGPIASESASYDSDGHLVVIEVDNSVDGAIDIRKTWGYATDASVGLFQQDGQQPFDPPLPPPPDGVPDQASFFPTACANIAMVPAEIYQFPSWAWDLRVKPRSND